MNKDSTRPTSPAEAPKTDPRLAAALARGELVRQKLALDEGGSLSSAQAARLLGISTPTALRRWRRRQLVAWKQGRCVRFPVWQFAGNKALPGVEEILQVFDSDDQWRVVRYFLANRRSLAGRRPLDLLRQGKVAEVFTHAKIGATENTW